jgi:CO/xanthine dehydrogenase FAD-binding subunit
MKFADFLLPESFAEASEALAALGDKGYPVAGGTAFQYLSDRPGVTAVDISRLGLDGIEMVAGGFRVGATTSVSDLAVYRAPGWPLAEVAARIPFHPVRNGSTLGGNIARLFPWSDLPLALMAIDAAIVIRGRAEERTLSSEAFFGGGAGRLLTPGELVISVEVPAVAPPTGFGFKKETTTIAAFALMTGAAALTLEDGAMRRVRVAANSALPTPMRLPGIEQRLEGQPADAALFSPAIEAGTAGLPWRGREGMSDDFGAHLARVILDDVLRAALAAARGEEPGAADAGDPANPGTTASAFERPGGTS